MHLNRAMEGRKCYVYLPNDKKLELTVHPKQLGKDLYDIVASELKLKERDYFGLTYKTSGEHYAWVQDDKKVLEHDMQLKATDFPLEFLFSMKFYEDSVTVHKYPTTVEIIFLHVRNMIYKGDVDVSSDLSFELAALCLQAVQGDHICDEKATSDLKNLSCLPYRIIRQHHSSQYCEERIISLYKKLNGTTRGEAVLHYMSKSEKLGNYGVHYYKVKDKSRITWWLGISNKGICQYNFNDKITPHLVFHWRSLENLYFREKKFSVEVCSGQRRAGVQEQSQKQPTNNQAPKTYAWYGSPALIKSIWIMAIAQHQFYWDRKQSSKTKHHHSHKNNTAHLRAALDNNSDSLLVPPPHRDETDSDNMPRKNVRNAEVTIRKAAEKKELTPEMKAVQKKLVEDLKQRKLDLEDRLYDKVQELKEICKEEYDLTERIPIEYLRYLLPGEPKPVLRKKVKTEYAVKLRRDQKRIPTSSFPQDPAAAEELQQLEADCELLNQITKAAHKLAHDPSTRGRSRRKRLESYQKSLKKLQDLENKIDELRKRQGKVPATRQSVLIAAPDMEIMDAIKECSLDDKSERSSLSDGMMLDDETSVSSGAEALSTHSTPALTFRPNSESADVDMDDIAHQRSKTPPPTKLAWYESPRVKNKREVSLSPNGSYPVLASPGSYRSSPSHSSGTGTPPQLLPRRDWIQPKWEHPRHQNGWKVSSLDSLESVGSRRSNEHSNHSDLAGSPVSRHSENANSMRIARALESPSRASKVSLRERRKHSEPSRRMGTVNPVVEIVEGTNPENGKDSRTTLTDSGHVTSSETHLQGAQEDDGQHKLNSNVMRREISDSSLSELSTQSNPAALPSSGHHPKFYPFFMSRTRARTAHVRPEETVPETKAPAENQSQQAHIRKRSSSFTESGSSVPKATLRRDNHRTLSRSKTHHEGEPLSRIAGAPSPDGSSQFRASSNGDATSYAAPNDHKGLLSTSQSANELPPPMFDTNLNICRQYLSGSQGQLTQNNIDLLQQAQADPGQFEDQRALADAYQSAVGDNAWSDISTANPANVQRYGQNVSVNNSNNKLNFGQIYKISQGGQNPEVKRLHSQPNHLSDQNVAAHSQTFNKNVPKCNSLDSVLDSRVHDPTFNPDTVKNYALEPQNPAAMSYGYTQGQQMHPGHTLGRPAVNQHQANVDAMTHRDRDKYNNEAFEEIRGMSWVPSLDEYGSRASVAESLPAKSKKEDIMQLLHQHIAHWKPKRTPSTSSSATLRNKADSRLRAKIRAEILRDRENQQQMDPYAPREVDANTKTWEDYKQNMQTLKRNRNQPPKSEQSGGSVNIFRHNPPPPSRQEQDQDSNQSNFYAQTAGAPLLNQQQYQQSTIQRVHKGYVNQNGYVIPIPVKGDTRTQQDHHFYNQSQMASGYRHQTQQHSTERTTAAPMQIQRRQADGQFQATQPESTPGQDMDVQGSKRKPRTRTTSGALVIQALTTSPDGHKVSVFSVAKSAPNTPLPDRKHEESSKSFLTDDEEDSESFNKTITSNSSMNATLSPDVSLDTHASKPRTIVSPVKSRNLHVDGPAVTPKQGVKDMPEGETVAKKISDGDKKNEHKSERTNSETDTLQAMAIEAAREAQKMLVSSRDNLLKFEASVVPPPSLPLVPPNASLRSSRRGRRQTSEIPRPASAAASERQGREKASRRTFAASPSQRRVAATPQSAEGRPRSRSRNRRNVKPGSDANRRAASPGNSLSSENLARPMEDAGSGQKSSSPGSHDIRVTHAPAFQRTLSTPSRSKPFSLSAANREKRNSPSKTKSSGMYKEAISGLATKNLPPTGPKYPAITSTSPPIQRSGVRQQGVSRTSYHVGYSGTLPRAPKSSKKVERSGSTTGAILVAAAGGFSVSRPSPIHSQTSTRQNQSSRYHNTAKQPPRRNTLHTPRLDEDLQYKRSLSENWNQQPPMATIKVPQHHSPLLNHPHQMYHHLGHHGMAPTGGGDRTQGPPRRTASADDLLWSPDAREQNTYNMGNQQGTLV